MDYLQTLPPDVLRQTAMSLPAEDVIKLIDDENLNKILNSNFWLEKYRLDYNESPDYPIYEPYRNYYILALIEVNIHNLISAENEIFEITSIIKDVVTTRDYNEIEKITNDLTEMIKQAKKAKQDIEKYGDLLYSLRIQQFPYWPRQYDIKPDNPKEFDRYKHKVWYDGKWSFLHRCEWDIVKSFGLDYEVNVDKVIRQVYPKI
jgi:hypothetical protein